MIIEPDYIRAYVDRIIGNKNHSIGIADKMLRQCISIMIRKKNLLVFWGSPGSGKSFLSKQCDNGNHVILETTGLNKAWNKFLLALPSPKVTYHLIYSDLDTCIDRICNRTCNPLGNESVEYLIKLARQWHEQPLTNMLPYDTITNTTAGDNKCSVQTKTRSALVSI